MDNGAEVFAKLPNHSAGPAYYTTASEVATRTFVSVIQYIYQAWKIDFVLQVTRCAGYTHAANSDLLVG